MGEYRTPLPFRFGARLGKVVDRGSEPPRISPRPVTNAAVMVIDLEPPRPTWRCRSHCRHRHPIAWQQHLAEPRNARQWQVVLVFRSTSFCSNPRLWTRKTTHVLIRVPYH